MIDALIEKSLSNYFDDIRIIQKYKSKKNEVYEIVGDGQEYILKIFSKQRKNYLLPEISVLSCVEQHLGPTMFAYDEYNSFLLLEKIPGENLCEVLNNCSLDIKQKEKVMSLLANWFATFHKEFSMTGCTTVIRGDAILRNFIVSDKKIIGVDFEEARQENPYEDIGEICASILDTDPMFTAQKIKLVKIFLKNYEDQVLWRCDKDISLLIIKYLQNHLRFRKEDTAKKTNEFAKTIMDASLFTKQP